MNPIESILRHFAFAHLPERLQSVSRPVCELAQSMAAALPMDPETTVGLRKLLEAKDCFVRAELSRARAPISAQVFEGSEDGDSWTISGHVDLETAIAVILAFERASDGTLAPEYFEELERDLEVAAVDRYFVTPDPEDAERFVIVPEGTPGARAMTCVTL